MRKNFLSPASLRTLAAIAAIMVCFSFDASGQNAGITAASGTGNHVGVQVGSFEMIGVTDPKDKDNAFRNFLGVFRGNLCLKYHTPNDGNVLAVFDGQTIKMIPNPVEAPDPQNAQGNSERGVVGDAIVFRDKIYFKYFSAGGIFCLAEYDGTSLRVIPNTKSEYDAPNKIKTQYYVKSVRPVVFKDNLYLQYYWTDGNSSHLIMERFDGKSLREVNLSNDYWGKAVVYNDRLYYLWSFNGGGLTSGLAYFDGVSPGHVDGTAPVGDQTLQAGPAGIYQNKLLVGLPQFDVGTSSGNNIWALYDNKTLSPLPNPNGRGNQMGSPLIDKNNLYYYYLFASAVQIAKYDGATATAIPNPPRTGKFTTGMVAYNDKVYARYSMDASVALAQCDGKSVNLISMPNTKDINLFFVYNNRLFFDADNRLAEYDEHSVHVIDSNTSPYFNGNHIIYQDKLYISYMGKFARYTVAE